MTEGKGIAICDALHHVILSGAHGLQPCGVSSRRNLAEGRGVNSMLSTTGPLGGE
jgi:hypothetical protein